MPLAVVTGTSTGIGFHTAGQLAVKGYDVICACRRPDRANEVLVCLKDWYGHRISVEFAELDLTSFASVQHFASGLSARHKALDLLVCNAGVNSASVDQDPEGQLSEDGIDVLYQTNFLSHLLLVILLLPLLRAAMSGRVISVTSVVHRGANLADFSSVQRVREPYVSLYGLSKLAQIVTARELHRRFGRQGIAFHSVNPGGVSTDIWRGYSSWKQYVFRVILASPETAAETVVMASSSSDGAPPSTPLYWNGYMGASRSSIFEYWSPRPARASLVSSEPSSDACDVELGRRVFEDSIALIRAAGVNVDLGVDTEAPNVGSLLANLSAEEADQGEVT